MNFAMNMILAISYPNGEFEMIRNPLITNANVIIKKRIYDAPVSPPKDAFKAF